MKLRMPARPDLPQIDTVAVWQSTVQQPEAAAPFAALCATDSSSDSASSQLASDRQASIPRLSALERVSPDALALILQYLIARDRLTVIRRLSRAFRTLPPRAFQHDSIASLLPDGAVTDSREKGWTAELRRLSLTVHQSEEPGRWTLFTCPRSLRSLPHFSTLETLRIDVKLPGWGNWTATLRCLLRSVLSLQSLQRLRVALDCTGQRPEADWTDSELPTAASLRHLELSGLSLSASSILRLFSLPLESLDLHGSLVLDGGDDAAVSPEQTVSSSASALRALSLPDSSGSGSLRTLELYVRLTEQSGSQLERLTCGGALSRDLLSLVASRLQQLRELNLEACDVLSSHRVPAVPALMTMSLAPRLPLLAKLRLPASRPSSKFNGLWQSKLMEAEDAASEQLVAAYSAQLTALAVTVLSWQDIGNWLHLLLSRCRQLHSLAVRGLITSDEPPVELQSVGDVLPLVGLRRLELASLRVTDGSLLLLLSLCPELEHCQLTALPYVTDGGKEAAFRCCPKLRR